MASRFGKQEETPLGILHLDTKLFACSDEQATVLLKDAEIQPDATQEIYKVKKNRDQLEEFSGYGSNLYNQQDKNIEHLESFRDAIVPLLELYMKCRTGTP